MNNESTRRRKRHQQQQAAIIGLGLDNKDGHKRITTGDQFLIVDGSEETHGRMAEMMIKTFEELKRRHKRLENCDPKEVAEILERARPR